MAQQTLATRVCCEEFTIEEVHGVSDADVAAGRLEDRHGGRTAIFWASENGDYDVVEALLMRGAQVDACDEYGYTSLKVACKHSRWATVRLLLRHGANPRVQDADGWTALHHAAMNNMPLNIAKALVEHGANADAKTKQGNTPVSLARKNGTEAVVKFLEQASVFSGKSAGKIV